MKRLKRICQECRKTFYCNGKCNSNLVKTIDFCRCGKCFTRRFPDAMPCDLRFRREEEQEKVVFT